MPYPQNLKTAIEVEQIIRNHGAVPATIGIINGEIKIGLSRDDTNSRSSPGKTWIGITKFKPLVSHPAAQALHLIHPITDGQSIF
jgi:hypothetical protein